MILATCEQVLLVQDGKLYGRDPIFAVITKASALPEFTKNHDIQKSECFMQLGQVKNLTLGILILIYFLMKYPWMIQLLYSGVLFKFENQLLVWTQELFIYFGFTRDYQVIS